MPRRDQSNQITGVRLPEGFTAKRTSPTGRRRISRWSVFQGDELAGEMIRWWPSLVWTWRDVGGVEITHASLPDLVDLSLHTGQPLPDRPVRTFISTSAWEDEIIRILGGP